MRILLAANASYLPPKGGSTRSNLVWLRALAAAGHECLVLSTNETDSPDGELLSDGLRIRRITALNRRADLLSAAVEEFAPDFVLVSSEDLSHNLIKEAARIAPGRFLYLAHTPQWFPFGPESWNPDPEAARLARQATAIIVIGEHMAAYVKEHLGREAVVLHPSIYGTAPWPEFDNFDKEPVLLINPCTAKGLPIFLALAERFPNTPFWALRGWGTTPEDERRMAALPNVRLLDTVPEMDTLFSQVKLLLAPSLWYEGFALVVTEALLRGVPVLASNWGGLAESAASSNYRLPVNPIRRWLSTTDATGMPEAVVEAQPIDAWANALSELLTNRDIYQRERAQTRSAAHAFVARWQPTDLLTFLEQLLQRPRRLLLMHNSTYYPGSGGGDKSNRILMESLAARGYDVHVFTRLERFGDAEHDAFAAELARRGLATSTPDASSLAYELNHVRVHVLTRPSNPREEFRAQLRHLHPDILFVSTDDPAHLFLSAALEERVAHIVFLARATIALPFGPDASSTSQSRTERLHEVDAVIGVSEYVAQYCRDHAGLTNAIHVPISLGDHANPPGVGHFDNPYVAMVNPSGVKGLPILLALADAFPEQQFAAVPSWGTTDADKDAMRARPNILLHPHVENITDLLKNAKATLVPSLWAEARSRMVVESLSRGVPVLAADVGGLREAMCGMDYVLPVNPIRHYRTSVSDQMAPEAEVPPQDITPWANALRELLHDRDHWQDLSTRGREAALAYLASISTTPLEAILERIFQQPRKQVTTGPDSSQWSPARRKLLSLRLARWREEYSRKFFPTFWGNADANSPDVFLFPWAGAGAGAWRFLRDAFSANATLRPCSLPGREVRREETPPASFAALVSSITDELSTLISSDKPYVLAGHSMGGGLAFEVARELRRRALPLPSGLVLSSCRAPQRRRSQPAFPPATDAQLLANLLRDETVSPESAAYLLPILRLDTELFRQHNYPAEAPLPIPIEVIFGRQEPYLEPIDGESWAAETTAPFHFTLQPGQHLWLKDQPRAFAAAILSLLPPQS